MVARTKGSPHLAENFRRKSLKAQAIQILSRGSVDDLVDEVIDGLAAADVDALTIYLPVVEEKRITRAFDVIKGLAPELIADWAGHVLATGHALNPEGAVAWATEHIMQTQDARVFFGFLGTLEQRGIDLQSVPGFIARVSELFAFVDNRELPGFYEIVRRYQIPGASAVIAGDLRLILGPEACERNMPVWDMYETLAALPELEGHQSLIQHVRVCPAHHRLPILEYLAKYRPELARTELPHHRDDAELVVREGVERLLAELSTPTNKAAES